MDDGTFEGHVVPSVSIDNMLNQRAAVMQRLEQAIHILREARELALAAHVGFPRLKIETNRWAGTFLEDPPIKTMEQFQREVDSTAWQYLMNESGLRTFMDAEARKNWDDGIQEGKFPELTRPNVEATFKNLHGARGDMFERGVLKAFKSLSWDYKTNRPFKFGKRIVMRWIRGQMTANRSSIYGATSLGHVNMRSSDSLDDLTRVFAVLDGKPEPDHRVGWYRLLNQCSKTTDPDAEDDYMRIKCYRNGNGHVTFKRPDLVDQLNTIIAKHYPGALAYDKGVQ